MIRLAYGQLRCAVLRADSSPEFMHTPAHSTFSPSVLRAAAAASAACYLLQPLGASTWRCCGPLPRSSMCTS